MSKRLQKSCVDEVLVMAKLESGLAKLIEELKYQNARNLAPFLAKLLYRHLQIPPADCLTFVPLHPQKLRSRGYNQCQEIALALGKLTQLPVLDLLIRTKHLEAQAHVKSQKSRLERLQGVFVLRENCTHRVKNKHILILDDVLTTGATLNEVSRVLKLAGARYITGLILASKAK